MLTKVVLLQMCDSTPRVEATHGISFWLLDKVSSGRVVTYLAFIRYTQCNCYLSPSLQLDLPLVSLVNLDRVKKSTSFILRLLWFLFYFQLFIGTMMLIKAAQML